MTKLSALSVFFPAYNEEKNIRNTVEKAIAFLPKVTNQFEVIVINDGSTDNTQKIVDELSKKHKQVRIVDLGKNLGYGSALKNGFYSCRYPYIAFSDSDGQFDIKQLDRFIEKIEKCDLVVGFRLKRRDLGIRHLNAKAWGFLIGILFNLKFKDIDCGFKLIKKEVIDTILKLESSGALISAELLIKAKKAGFKICEVGVDHYPRAGGQQTGANLKVITMAFWELFKLYGRLK